MTANAFCPFLRFLPLALVLSLVAVRPTHAEMRLVDETPPGLRTGKVFDFAHVEIFGEIRASDAKKLLELLAHVRNKTTWRTLLDQPMLLVVLNSNGGDLLAAQDMGRKLRQSRAMVWVRGECASACIFLLAGGVYRFALYESRLGLHRPRFEPEYFANLPGPEARRRYTKMIEESRSYLAEMGLASSLMEDLLRIPSQKVKYIDLAAAESYGILGEDPAHAEWVRAQLYNKIGPEGLKAQDKYVECLNSGVPQSVCNDLQDRKAR